MHGSSMFRMQRLVAEYLASWHGRPLRILEVGSCDVNGTYRALFEDPAWEYVGLDAAPGPSVDVVPRQPYRWPEVRRESFDVVLSGQTFEHVRFPWVTMLEVERVLRRGGLFFLIVPSSGPEHRFPIDCWRFYPDGLVALAHWADLDVIDAVTYWEAEGWDDDSDDWRDSVLVARKRNEGARLRAVLKRTVLRRSCQLQAFRREGSWGRPSQDGSLVAAGWSTATAAACICTGVPSTSKKAPRRSDRHWGA